jgi:hypothetical protein
MHINRSQSQTYQKQPELKQKLTYTKSCPNGQIINPLKSHRSESSNHSSGSVVPKLPPNFRQGSVSRTISISSNGLPSNVELNSDESTTSSSLFHGIILVSIMLSSLIAFICSKIKRPNCDNDTNNMTIDINANDCPMAVVLYFSVTTIISCLISFIIYFLHLIGQCDVSWLAKRKFAIEIIIISTVTLLLIIANSLMVSQTKVLDDYIGILSIVCSSSSIIGYGIRMTKLCSECKYFSKRSSRNSNSNNEIDETALTIMKEALKSKINGDTNKSWEVNDNRGNSSSSNHRSSASAMRVISYVKRKRSVESVIKSLSQQTNVTNDHLNGFDTDIDDDVFIQ